MDEKTVEAAPTKELFITVLVRDIDLISAVKDLVDNSVDGATNTRGDSPLDGLSVDIHASPERFVIEDNCGGISIDTARHYAFRFGRPKKMPATKHSIGQFGVGMKRALFKMGKRFTVRSVTANSRFTLDVDVEKWSMDDSGWNFEFDELQENVEQPVADIGTKIEVTNLHADIKTSFSLENFLKRLRSEVEAAQQSYIERGLQIKFNGEHLASGPNELLTSGELQPSYLRKVYFEDSDTPVRVRIFAGLSASDPDAAGWYIYCNGRLLLKADQSALTGWAGKGEGLPKFHDQYNRFRGFVFFDSDSSERLPWNTTKTTLDPDSALFNDVRAEMIEAARPVKNFLDRLKVERENKNLLEHERWFEGAVLAARKVGLTAITTQALMQVPDAPPKKGEPQIRRVRIQYDRPVDLVEKVKKRLKVTTAKEAGEKTFDYFFKLECEE